jgi:iron(III) transport system permease protein
VPVGTVLAWLLTRTDLPGRVACLAVLLLNAFTPLPIQALAWLGGFGNLGRQQALGSSPWLVGWPAAAFVHAVAALPWVVLIVGVGVCSVEPELEEAARLHLTPLRVALGVTLRRAWGAIGAACLLVAALAATDMTVTDLIPVRTYAEESYLLSQLGIDQAWLIVRATLPQALVLGAGTAALAIWLSRLDLRRLAGVNRPRWQMSLGRARLPLALAVGCLLALLVGLPLEALIWRAGRVGGGTAGGGPHWSLGGLLGSLSRAWVDLVSGVGQELQPTQLEPLLPAPGSPTGGVWQVLRAPLPGSFVWSAAAATVSVALGWTLAWVARGSLVWRITALVLFVLALATPGPIVGLALKQTYAEIRLWNRTPVLVVMGSIVRSLPYSLMLLGPVLWSWPRAWVEEARMAGLGPWRQAGRLALPLTATAAAVAWLFAFVYGLGELPAAYLTRAPGYELVALLVWSLLHTGVESRLAAIGLVLLALLAIPAMITLVLLRQAMPATANRAA